MRGNNSLLAVYNFQLIFKSGLQIPTNIKEIVTLNLFQGLSKRDAETPVRLAGRKFSKTLCLSFDFYCRNSKLISIP